MALSDKNIIITPNIGQAADPKIEFIGADSSTGAQTITLNVYPTSGGMISFEGSSGQLFSVTNSLTGTIYSVTDISGVPSIEVLDSGLVKLAQYNGNVLIGTGTNLGSRVHISSGTPSGVGAMPSGVVTTQSSSGNNYLLFRNTADNGTYAGLAFQDNNIGGYVIFGNAGGGGDLLYVAGYGGGQLQYGSADSISPGSRTTVASWNGTGLQVNSGDFRTPFIYDSNDTGYYVDPNSMSRMSRVDPDEIYNHGWFRNHYSGKGLYNQVNGTHFYSNGSAAWAITGSGGNVELQFRSNHESTMRGYVYANTGGSIGFLDYNGNWRIRGDTANVELYGGTYIDTGYAYIVYDRNDTGYYLDPNSVSNLNVIRVNGNSTFFPGQTSALGFENQSSFFRFAFNDLRFYDWNNGYDIFGLDEHAWANNSFRAPIFYDRDNTAFYCDPSSTTRLSGLIVGYGSASSTIDMYDSDESTRYIHNNSSTIGFLGSHGSWRFRMADDGNLVMGTYQAWLSDQIRSGIYYEHSDTGYYCDPASTSNLYKVTAYQGAKYQTTDWADGFRNTPTSGRTFHGDVSSGGPQGSWWFYDSMRHSNGANYWGTQIAYGWEDNANELWQRNITSNSFSSWVRYLNSGNYTGILDGRYLRENVWINDKYFGTDGLIYCNQSRAYIMYDRNDSGYYCDPNSSSRLDWVNANGLRTYSNLYIDNDYGRTIVGVYTSTRLQGVFAMGDSYKLPPDGSNGGSLYGIAWSHPNAGGVAANLNTHGMLVMENGGFLAAVSGSIRARDDMRAPIFYDSNDTGYYLNPNGGSYLNSLTLAGGAYFRPQNWIQLDSTYGMYWPNHYGAHIHANDLSTYTQLAIRGSKNSYGGMYDQYSGVNGMMYDSSGNGGIYRESDGRWYLYHHLARNCLGVGTSTTDASWGLRCVKGGYFDGRVDGSIFYDANDTTYYVDPSSTSTSVNVAGSIVAAGNVTAYSDIRVKQDVQPITDAVSKVQQLRGVTFLRTDVEDSRQTGLIAQDVLKVLPEAVRGSASGMYSVAYGNMAGLLVEAIKEQQSQITELKALVAQLLAK